MNCPNGVALHSHSGEFFRVAGAEVVHSDR